jgi:hypothetical protein
MVKEFPCFPECEHSHEPYKKWLTPTGGFIAIELFAECKKPMRRFVDSPAMLA